SQGPPAQDPAYPVGPPSGQPMGQPFPGAAPGGAPAPGEPGSMPAAPGPQPAAEQRKKPQPGFDDRGRVRSSKISGLWVGVVAVAIVLILLIIFIGQNLDRVTIHFLGWSGSFPVGLVALISAVVGVLIAAIPGSIRIWQLRTALKRNVRKDPPTQPAA
ncbi:MAG TPA: LapA family protein, partial [Jatrophihabitans sp.]|nr:LapA family protein [Jatrophihabitans sp.]